LISHESADGSDWRINQNAREGNDRVHQLLDTMMHLKINRAKVLLKLAKQLGNAAKLLLRGYRLRVTTK
jgi:hypothetical protein